MANTASSVLLMWLGSTEGTEAAPRIQIWYRHLVLLRIEMKFQYRSLNNFFKLVKRILLLCWRKRRSIFIDGVPLAFRKRKSPWCSSPLPLLKICWTVCIKIEIKTNVLSDSVGVIAKDIKDSTIFSWSRKTFQGIENKALAFKRWWLYMHMNTCYVLHC